MRDPSIPDSGSFGTTSPAPSSETLRKNLSALSRSNPAIAASVERAVPAELVWVESKAGPWTATRELSGRPVTLASRYDPVGEADKLTRELDDDQIASAAVLGFGVGYHAAAAHRTLGSFGVLIVFEPDVALLRATLERVDHSAWLGEKNVFVFGPDADRSELTARLEGFAAVLTQGTRLVTHPPSRRFAPESFTQFSTDLADLMAYCRTNLATALVNASRTCRNLALNLGVYGAGATTDDLHDAAKGRVAVCVGAGPSLVRNVDLLADPDLRKRVVLIAVQTALRPLLVRGIRPDFVTALDYSPICARFYEGLPPLPEVTLVAEPKAHPAVLDAFPGPVRLLKNDFSDRLLGDLARPRVALNSGATVAHLSVYLAQHLGCNPIVLIGQDLGFSDGLYYAPGTAVHKVWACELSPINTIEMMEWTRIARMRGSIRRMEDVHGRPCFSDEQMLTYLKQFERDFKEMADAGTAVIDATEGGLPKAHTTRAALRDTLERHATADVPRLPLPSTELDDARHAALTARLAERVKETQALGRLCRESTALLDEMQKHLSQKDKLNKLFKKLDVYKARVHGELGEIFALVNTVNIIGAFHRQRNDRLIERSGVTDHEKLGRQLKRDQENLRWLGQASEEALAIFRDALDRAERQRRAMKEKAENPGAVDQGSEAAGPLVQAA